MQFYLDIYSCTMKSIWTPLSTTDLIHPKKENGILLHSIPFSTMQGSQWMDFIIFLGVYDL